jgi:hypothetical protein
VTLAEFLHPLGKTTRTDQVLAVLLFHKRYAGKREMSAVDVHAALVQARVPAARGTNVHQALARSGRYAHQARSRGPWAITESGEHHLRDRYGISGVPADAQPRTEVSALRDLANRVSDEATRDYIGEALECLQVGARRAAVVFLWSGAVTTIREAMWKHGARTIESALQRHNQRARFTKKNDFDYVKDADLLQAAQDLGVYDKSQKRHLGDALDLRNDCGHPVKYKPGRKKVESFVEDMLSIVWPLDGGNVPDVDHEHGPGQTVSRTVSPTR